MRASQTGRDRSAVAARMEGAGPKAVIQRRPAAENGS